MNEKLAHLNSHYKEAFLESGQLDFYWDVWTYIGIIVNDEELSSFMSDEALRLKNKIEEINNDPLLKSDIKEEVVDRTKNSSVYGMYIKLYTGIYLPIEDNQNNVNYYSEEIKNNLFYISGYENLPESQRPQWQRQFENYFEKRKKEFANLHTKLCSLIEKRNTLPIEKKLPINFYFNTETGSFKYNNTESILSPKSREFKLLKTLYTSSNHQASYKELCENSESVSSYSKKLITDTIKVLKKKLNITPKKKGSNPDIIKNISKYGYKLDI